MEHSLILNHTHTINHTHTQSHTRTHIHARTHTVYGNICWLSYIHIDHLEMGSSNFGKSIVDQGACSTQC